MYLYRILAGQIHTNLHPEHAIMSLKTIEIKMAPSSNPRSHFVNSQLVCLLPVGIFNYVTFINRAAMGRARFMFYPWFIFFYIFFVGDQTQISTRPTLDYAICNVYSPNLVSSGSTKISDYKITPNLHVAKKSLQNPDIEAIYHFSVNSYLISAVLKSIR